MSSRSVCIIGVLTRVFVPTQPHIRIQRNTVRTQAAAARYSPANPQAPRDLPSWSNFEAHCTVENFSGRCHEARFGGGVSDIFKVMSPHTEELDPNLLPQKRCNQRCDRSENTPQGLGYCALRIVHVESEPTTSMTPVDGGQSFAFEVLVAVSAHCHQPPQAAVLHDFHRVPLHDPVA